MQISPQVLKTHGRARSRLSGLGNQFVLRPDGRAAAVPRARGKWRDSSSSSSPGTQSYSEILAFRRGRAMRGSMENLRRPDEWKIHALYVTADVPSELIWGCASNAVYFITRSNARLVRIAVRYPPTHQPHKDDLLLWRASDFSEDALSKRGCMLGH